MKFEILGPNSEVVQVVEKDGNSIKIGKNVSCELCLDDASISRVHAVLEKTATGYKLTDRISAGGTYVNQQKVDPTKPVFIEDGAILTFGKVSVRFLTGASSEGASSSESATSSESSSSNSNQVSSVLSATASQEAAPAVTMSKPSLRPVAGSGGGGFGSAGVSLNANTSGPQKVIRKKKRQTSFERRFLSGRGTGTNCILEVAEVWNDQVMSVKSFQASNKRCVTVGNTKKCDFQLASNDTFKSDKNGKVTITSQAKEIKLVACENKRWEILFNPQETGFILDGDKKIEFKDASDLQFKPSQNHKIPNARILTCSVHGDIRAKFDFGEQSFYVRYVNMTPIAKVGGGGMDLGRLGGFIASLIIHFAFFSLILFATDRVDALMVDRILTASRFAIVVEQPIEEEEPEEEEEEEEEKPEEEETDDSEPTEVVETQLAANNDSNKPMSKSEATSVAQNTGLMAQANAMNSMLSAGLDMANLDNLDWSSFDASAQAASAGYGLGTTGTGGGGAGMGGFVAGGFGPGGPGGTGAIRAAADSYKADLGGKAEAKPKLSMKNPEVTGSLDKRIIQRVVRQHAGELRACYEKEVAKIKGLNGRIVVVWLISPQGAVTKALVKETTMKNKNVENCIINSIKFWRFPTPKGGGLVQIEYPFVFELSSN